MRQTQISGQQKQETGFETDVTGQDTINTGRK